MSTEIRVPALGESVTEATVAQWLKQTGDTVSADEPLCELETDKANVEIPAPANGVLAEIRVAEGETVEVGALLGMVEETGAGAHRAPATGVPDTGGGREKVPAGAELDGVLEQADPQPRPREATPAPAAAGKTPAQRHGGESGEIIEIRVPTLGESVTEATVASWRVGEGESVCRDEPLCELETDKATVEVPAPIEGVLCDILVPEGHSVEVGAVLARLAPAGAPAAAPGPRPTRQEQPAKAGAPAAAAARSPEHPADRAADQVLPPAARKLAAEHGLEPGEIPGTGKSGRVTKADVLSFLDAREKAPEARPQAPAARPAEARADTAPTAPAPQEPREQRVRMTRLRKTIARRLKEAQNTAAMLTTFNEVDMTAVMEARNRYKDLFERKHDVRLGFMSFFAKACIVALKEIPEVNAEIDGEEVVYKNYYNIGVAVGTEQGLVVPVVRDADRKGFAEIEKEINALGAKAREGKLSLNDLQGGTFTISNGGIYGSLMSTPILNPPQSGILGMHRIQERPMVIDGRIEVRPMMYLALSYDHRLVDGREAVTFLVRVKEGIEDPERMLLDL
jgi:2-oxoglutarate dehydrogenase E2 component (dihydrolipoamide succinyltransferase)